MRKMRTKSNGNGQAQAAAQGSPSDLIAAPPSAPSPQGPVISVAKEHHDALRTMNQGLKASKEELADVTVRIRLMQDRQAELARRVIELDQKYVERVKEAATAAGLDLNLPWVFNLDQMAFAPPPPPQAQPQTPPSP